jgi:hypothetical protein
MKIEGLGYMGWGPTITEEETLGFLYCGTYLVVALSIYIVIRNFRQN